MKKSLPFPPHHPKHQTQPCDASRYPGRGSGLVEDTGSLDTVGVGGQGPSKSH